MEIGGRTEVPWPKVPRNPQGVVVANIGIVEMIGGIGREVAGSIAGNRGEGGETLKKLRVEGWGRG